MRCLMLIIIIITRGHTHQFEDFLLSWSETLRSATPSGLTIKLQKEIDQYQVRPHPLISF